MLCCFFYFRTRFIVTLSEAGDRLDHITTVKPGASGRIQLQKAEEPVEEGIICMYLLAIQMYIV